MFFKASLAVLLAAILVVTFLALPRDEGQARASDAEAAALERFPRGTVQPARVEDDEWEVDVVLPNGSLVEVTFDHALKLRDLDEEIGPVVRAPTTSWKARSDAGRYGPRSR